MFTVLVLIFGLALLQRDDLLPDHVQHCSVQRTLPGLPSLPTAGRNHGLQGRPVLPQVALVGHPAEVGYPRDALGEYGGAGAGRGEAGRDVVSAGLQNGHVKL